MSRLGLERAGLGCADFRAHLEAFEDGELSVASARAMRAHLEGCPRCRQHQREAASLPGRLRALPSPIPPPSLVPNVMRRVSPRRRALETWGLVIPEGLLVLVAAWYTSGVGGLAELGRRMAADVAASLSWTAGAGERPAPMAGDLFMLLVTLLLAGLSLWHLSLLARQSQRQPAA